MIEVINIGDEEYFQDLLMLAALDARSDVVNILLKHDFNVDHEDRNSLNAIDYAWIKYYNARDANIKAKSNEVILSLLKANSKFPRAGFKYESASNEVQSFEKKCSKIHFFITYNDCKQLKSRLLNISCLCHIYDKNNQSLMAHAIKSKNMEIIKLLIEHNLTIGSHEECDDTLQTFAKNDKLTLRKLNRFYAKNHPRAHIFILRMKSKIGNNDNQHHKNWKYVNEAFDILDKNETCSKILKVVAVWNKLEIIFDFTKDSVYLMDPFKSRNTLGTVYTTGIVYIGAKKLSNDDEKYEAIGVLIHELCHLAILLTYFNDFNPYPVSDRDKIQLFTKVFKKCKKQKNFEEIIESVYKYYIRKHKHSELIVTPMQMVMHYHIKDPQIQCENSEKIAKIQKVFSPLFKYLMEIVEPDFEKVVSVLEILQDESRILTFDTLTDPMKAKIQYLKVFYQGVKVNIYEVFSTEMLKFLSGNTIRQILLNSKNIRIGESCELNIKYSVMERKFEAVNNHKYFEKNPHLKDILDFETIQTEAEKSKVFILADTAGAGKTTIFKDLAIRLKKNNPTFWVSYIKLRQFRGFFEDFKKMKSDEKPIILVFKLLQKIINIQTNFDAKVFHDLFYNNKVILLFDGIDEISPSFNSLIVKILKIVRKNTRNQLWVSTRPQHAKQLENELENPTFKFVPYTLEQKQDFILEILKTSHVTDKTVINEIQSHFEVFFKNMEERQNGTQYNIDNPLMIEIITELYIKNEIDLELIDEFGLYDVYEKIIEKQKMRFNKKADDADHDQFVDFGIKQVYQVAALQFIFDGDSGKKYGFKLNDLLIVKNWNGYKHKWSNEKIQRFGILTIETDEAKKVNFDFIHRTYAEFFVAEYLIAFMLMPSGHPKEFEAFFKILCLIEKNDLNYKIIRNFLLSYITKVNKSDNYGIDILRGSIESILNLDEAQEIIFHDDMKEFFIKNIKKVRKNILKHLQSDDESGTDSLEFWSLLMSKDSEVLNQLWLLDIDYNFLKIILLNNKLKKSIQIVKVLDIVERSFGLEWNEKFNKKYQKMLNEDEIGNVEENENKHCQGFNRNIVKLMDLAEKNFKYKEQKIIFDKYLNCPKISKFLSPKIYKAEFRNFKYLFDNKDKSIYTATAEFIALATEANGYSQNWFFRFYFETMLPILNSIKSGREIMGRKT